MKVVRRRDDEDDDDEGRSGQGLTTQGSPVRALGRGRADGLMTKPDDDGAVLKEGGQAIWGRQQSVLTARARADEATTTKKGKSGRRRCQKVRAKWTGRRSGPEGQEGRR